MSSATRESALVQRAPRVAPLGRNYGGSSLGAVEFWLGARTWTRLLLPPRSPAGVPFSLLELAFSRAKRELFVECVSLAVAGLLPLQRLLSEGVH